MENGKMYQVATLQSLMTGYTRAVITVGELLKHGDTGLGTFEDVNGEMIVAEGRCYKASDDGSVTEAPADEGVPFSSVAFLNGGRKFDLENITDIDQLKDELTVKIEEWFGLNSMHIVQIDGSFTEVSARSESPLRTQHISLKSILSGTQKEFHFQNLGGTLIGIYYPDYMNGINAPGWHLHFLSSDRTLGGHVFDLALKRGTVVMDKLPEIEIQLPTSPAFDTYSLADNAGADIKAVEQGKK